MSPAGDRPFSPGFAAGSVFLASALVLALQIALIRALTVDTYHHFTYLVISTALLGFGASGTLLSLAWGHVKRHFAVWSALSIILLVIASAFAYRVAVNLRPDMQYVLFSVREVLRLWAHTLVLFIPFFAGGLIVGMVLSWFRDSVGGMYAANMVGSGLGGVGGVLLAFLVTPYRMPVVLSVLGLGALLLWLLGSSQYRHRESRIPTLLGVVAATAAVVAAFALPEQSSVDQYKAMAHALRIARQGDAEHLSRRLGPRAQIDVYDAPSMRHTLFAAPGAPAPPEQLALFLDGAHVGGILQIERAEQAEALRWTAQSLPYKLVDAPRVALLGESTGNNVWLALAHGAVSVTVVQANPQLTQTIRSVGPAASGGDTPGDGTGASGRSVLDHPAVEVVNAEPRLFLEREGERFDLIHFAEAEGMPAGSGGLASMREDYLLTVEAVRAAMRRLSDRGMITVTRGLQTPPRDNIRLFALFAEALRGRSKTGGSAPPARSGDGSPKPEPERHLLQGRNYLGVTTMLSAGPLGEGRIARFRAAASQLSMDVDYHPGITPADLTRRNRIPGPEGSPGSYLHHAALRLLSEERDAFYDDWVYDVTPPRDNRPYFHSFFKWDSLDRYIETYGQFWFQRLELGYAVVLVTFLQVLAAALLLVLVPILVLRRRRRPERRPSRGAVAWTILHFTAIGLGFLFLEMLHIQRFTRFLGDPIYSTAAVLTAILLFSGVGSYLQGRLGLGVEVRIRVGGLAVATLALLYYLGLDPILARAVQGTEVVRFTIALLLLLPLSFMLGWLMPAGLEVAGNRSAELVPLAWAVNGVASVAATPLAVMIAVGWGFLGVSLLAAGCYFAVALAAPTIGRAIDIPSE
ncbi:MAG: hypothetical protein ACLFO1_04685 [Spirochaetaceae bacterium]